LAFNGLTDTCSSTESPVTLSFCSLMEFTTFRTYVEIKCQLDATGVFSADLTACSARFGHHYAHHQELKSIIRWLLPVVFRAAVLKLPVWCGAEGYVSGLQDACWQASCKPNPPPYLRKTHFNIFSLTYCRSSMWPLPFSHSDKIM